MWNLSEISEFYFIDRISYRKAHDCLKKEKEEIWGLFNSSHKIRDSSSNWKDVSLEFKCDWYLQCIPSCDFRLFFY